ncbi:MAG: hypothetical protein ACK4YF_04095 [Exilispira sp.]
MKSNSKIFAFLFFTLTLIFFLSSCAPISSQQDAEKFTNAMIKGYMIGDSDVSKSALKVSVYTSDTITVTEISADQLQSKFSGSHFVSNINTNFDGVTFTYSSTNLIYDNETYIVSGQVHWALDVFLDSSGFHGVFIAYGTLQVSKNGQNQNVIFDAKYTTDFTLTDSDDDGIYSISFTGSFISYVNDFVVNNSSWSITFEGQLFGAAM